MGELLTLVGEGFGLGRVAWLRGLAGTGLGLVLAWWIASRALPFQAALAAALAAMAIVVCHAAALAAIRPDPSRIIADEFLTMPVAVIGWTAGRRLWAVPLAVAATALLDRAKPFPANWAESLPGGVGIVLDDLVAAGYVLTAGAAIALLLGRRSGRPSRR